MKTIIQILVPVLFFFTGRWLERYTIETQYGLTYQQLLESIQSAVAENKVEGLNQALESVLRSQIRFPTSVKAMKIELGRITSAREDIEAIRNR